MACRRCVDNLPLPHLNEHHHHPNSRDRANLIGCHVGSVRLRGCSRECCPYGSDTFADIVFNERYDYNRDPIPKLSNLNSNAQGPRSGACINPYRYKFVCLECRRTFKPAYVEGNEYQFDYYRNVRTRPERERIAEVWQENRKMYSGRKRNQPEVRKLEEQWLRYQLEGKEALRPEELEGMKSKNPDMWWTSLDKLRCPGCGKEGKPVGGTFRPPKKGDDKGWLAVSQMLDSGEKFSYCQTPAGEVEVVAEAQRLASRKEREEEWKAEKARRIAMFQQPSRDDHDRDSTAGATDHDEEEWCMVRHSLNDC